MTAPVDVLSVMDSFAAAQAAQKADEGRDAARYRWLRECNHVTRTPDVVYGFFNGAENLDAAINAAMKESKS